MNQGVEQQQKDNHSLQFIVSAKSFNKGMCESGCCGVFPLQHHSPEEVPEEKNRNKIYSSRQVVGSKSCRSI